MSEFEIPFYDWQAKLESGNSWTSQEVEPMFKELMEARARIAEAIADEKRDGDRIAELENKIKSLRAGFKWQVDALETLQKMLDSQNDLNPWLGIAAAVASEQIDLDMANKRISKMEKELLGAKKVIELAYENRFKVPGMLQALNNYEDALKG